MLRSLIALGLIALITRDLSAAASYFADTSERAGSAGEPFWEGVARLNLATGLMRSGQVTPAMEILTPLPAFCAEQEDRLSVGAAYHLIGEANRLLGNHAAALSAIDAALKIAEEEGNWVSEAHWLIEGLVGE